MSQKATERRVLLNLDVWRHSATFLDVAGLCVLATAGKESQKLVSSVPADVWRANLCALAPAIARAFPEKRDARNLCRAWLRRWRATDSSDDGHRSRLCVPNLWGPEGGRVRVPHVVFAVGDGDECGGVMKWDSILSAGTKDDDNSLVLIPGARDCPRLYTEDEISDLATSCFVVDPERTMMIELWQGDTYFSDFGGAQAGTHMTYMHGKVLLSRCRSDAPESVLDHMLENEDIAPGGTEVMTPMGYVRFRDVQPSDATDDPLYQIIDAAVSIGISEKDTQYGFADLAVMLTMALRNHPDSDWAHPPDPYRAVFIGY